MTAVPGSSGAAPAARVAVHGGATGTGRMDRRLLLGVLAAALALRLGFVLYLDVDRIYFGDTIDYLNAAESLLAGRGFGEEYQRAPLYPVFLAGILAVFPGSLLAVRLVETLLGALIVLAAYGVGREIWGPRVGLLGAGLAAVHPYLVVLAGFLYSETLFTLLLVGAVYVLLRARRARGAFGAGLLGGAASLAKASGLTLLPVGAAWLLLLSGVPRPRRAAATGAFLVGASALLAPWLLRNVFEYGRLSPLDARAGVHLPYRVDGRFLTKVEAVDHYRERGRGLPLERDAVAEVLGSPGAYAAFVGRQFLQFWSFKPERLETSELRIREKMASRDERMLVRDHPVERTERYGTLLAVLLSPYYACALLGLWASRDRLRKASLPLFVTLGFALGYALFFAKLRYRIPIEPFVALFAAAGAWEAWNFVRRRTSGQAAGVADPSRGEELSADARWA